MNRKCSFVRELGATGNHAGNKARQDVDAVFLDMLDKPVFSYREHRFKGVFDKVSYLLNLETLQHFYQLAQIKGQKICVQYPFYCNPVLEKLLTRLVERNSTALFIHDVDSLRNFGKARIANEIRVFNSCKFLVVHNSRMKAALLDLGVETPMISLELFDYLRDSASHPARKLSPVVSFAGNLNKSTFLHKNLDDLGIELYLYGINYDEKKITSPNIKYQGSFSPDEIPEKLDGSFGLIWDGNSTATCDGSFGEYLQYNNPHKLSLYISSCLPVIVWSKAAIADLVKKYNIGFCVDSLGDIKDVLDSMQEEDYARYLENIRDLQEKVIHGYFTKVAIERAVEGLHAEE